MIKLGSYVEHIPTGHVRRVSGMRGRCVHFAQVIKHRGRTYYWANITDCGPVRFVVADAGQGA